MEKPTLMDFSKELLRIAREDGWHAAYDPGNTETSVRQNGRVVSIEDGLGRLPTATVADHAQGPEWNPDGFNGHGSALYGCTGLPTELRTGRFPNSLQQPTFVLTIVRSAAEGREAAGRVVLDGLVPGGRQAVLASSAFRGRWGAFAGNEFGAQTTVDSGHHVIGFQTRGPYGPKGSRLFIDGAACAGESTGQKSNRQSMSGLVLGGHVNDPSRGWVGEVGPVLVFRGIPNMDVRDRMTLHLFTLVDNASGGLEDRLFSENVLLTDGHHDDVAIRADEVQIAASLTKMLSAYMVRLHVPDDRLTECVQVGEEDKTPGLGLRLRTGDRISYYDLLCLMMLPSHNGAAEIAADRIGLMLPGTGSSSVRFMAGLNDLARSWQWDGAEFRTPSGLGTKNRATARQMAELLWRIHSEDKILAEIMGKAEHVVSLGGPSERQVTVQHSIQPEAEPRFPEFIAGKTGGLNRKVTIGNVAMIVEHAGKRKMLVTMGAQPVNARFTDARLVLDSVAAGRE